MTIKFSCLITFFLGCCLAISAQEKKFIYYFDAEFNPATKDKAIINGVGSPDGKGIELNLYLAATKALLITEHFTDSSLQVLDGLYQEFNKKGRLAVEGNYLNSSEQGNWSRWDEAGHKIDSSIFVDGKKTIEVHKGYFKNGQQDSLVINDPGADTIYKKYYDDKGIVLSEVRFHGNDGVVSSYEKGILKSTDSVFSRVEIEASFPFGELGWGRYIQKELVKNGDDLIRDGQTGTCRIRFIVDKSGNVKDVKALNMADSKLAQIAINAIRKGPKWTPAQQYGRFVNAFREQPVTFSMEEH